MLIEPWTGVKLRKESLRRRDLKPKSRAMKSNAGIATCGIITFGHKAQKRFARLSKKTQDTAFLDIANAIAGKLNTTLTGLVVHLDESAIHAHVQFVGYTHDGAPVSDQTKKRDTSALQDLAAEIIGQYDPNIERGRRIKERLEGGAAPHETVNRQVNLLHRDLPLEIEELRDEIARLQAIKSKLERYIRKIEAKEIYNQKEAKRLVIYEQRLQKKEAELLEQSTRFVHLEATVKDIETRRRKAEWHAERAEKRQRDAEEIERLSLNAAQEALRQEAKAKERTPPIMTLNHIDHLPAPLRAAIDETAAARGYLPLKSGTPNENVDNTRSFLETYIHQIAATIYHVMAKTITDLRRHLRTALKREKDLQSANSGLLRENERLRAENQKLRVQKEFTTDVAKQPHSD